MLEANTKEFNRQIKKLQKKLPEASADILKKVTIDAYRELQKRTPKDTNRAAGGWNASIDLPPSEWKPPEGKKAYALKPLVGKSKIKYNSEINISNNVEYIIPLDKGHSKIQAPMGITEVVLQKITNYMKQLIAVANKRVYK